MAYVSIADRWLNRQKRSTEAVVVTLDSILSEGQGPREDPEYIISWDGYTADVIEPDTIITKAFIIVDEEFPSGTVANVDVAGTSFFADAALPASGVVVSATEDVYFKRGQTVTISVNAGGSPAPITQGKLRVVFETVKTGLSDGAYAG